jgi:Lon protease-like protein
MFPLSNVVFPRALLPLHIFEPRYRALVSDCLEADRELGIVLIERGSEVGGGDQRSGLGTIGVITEAHLLPDGRWLIAVEGWRRLRVIDWLVDDPYPLANIDELADSAEVASATQLAAAEAAVRRASDVMSTIGGSPLLPSDLALGEDASDIVWRLCALAPLNALDRQILLATDSTVERLQRLTAMCIALADDLSDLHGGPRAGPSS